MTGEIFIGIAAAVWAGLILSVIGLWVATEIDKHFDD